MAKSNDSKSPLRAAAGAAGPYVTSAFELLSHELRLSILLALWEVYDPYGPTEAMSFSELYDRVSVRDSANFTYHLDKLTPHFVAKTDDGYQLRNTGLTIVRAVIAGAGLEETTVASTKLGISCSRCGEKQVTISYQNGIVYLVCSNCDGFTASEELPQGTIAAFEFDPAGLPQRTPAELLAASAIRGRNNHRMMMEGVCPVCSGPVTDSLQLCDEHSSGRGELCPNCGKRDSARVRYVCTVCKHKNSRPVELTVIDHPAVISYFDEHNVDIRWSTDDPEHVIDGLERLWAMEHHLVSNNPVEIHLAVPCEGNELQVVLDEALTVVDVSDGY